MPRLTVLLTSPRVAPGLLTGTAWRRIAEADHRWCADVGDPLAVAVVQAGHVVEQHDESAGDLLAACRALAPQQVVWLAGSAPWRPAPASLVETDEVDVLHGSFDLPGARLLDLVEVMDRLRRDCPWDREQTHRSLARYLLEETYETLEAIESGNRVDLQEELGDLLLQVCFHARIASESADGFDVDDVADGIREKLVRRHPHVFAGLAVDGVADVEANWETLKAAEKGRASVLDGVPMALPALALADKVAGRAARVGVRPRSGDASGGSDAESGRSPGDRWGDRLLELVLEAREGGVDPEQALRDAVRRLTAAVRAAEA